MYDIFGLSAEIYCSGSKWSSENPLFGTFIVQIWGSYFEKGSNFWHRIGKFDCYYTLKTAYFYSKMAPKREKDLVCPF